MGLFLLTAAAPKSTRGGIDGLLVVADDATKAREIAAAQFSCDLPWKNTTLVTAATFSTSAPADYTGWRVEVELRGAAGAPIAFSASYTGVAGNAIDDVGAGIAAALVATGIAGAAYTAGTNTLTVADTTDGLGDHLLSIRIFSPGSEEPLPSFVGTIVDRGSAGAAVTVVLVDHTALPKVLLRFRSEP